MFLAIDIGNTHTVFGVYDGATLRSTWRIPSALSDETELDAHVQTQFVENNIHPEAINGAGISSVVPALTNIYGSIVRKHCAADPFIINTSLNLGITIHYTPPDSLGADRICTTVAGYEKYGGPLIIIDLGTATTYDIVGANGDFLGGIIAPGIGTSSASLHRHTAQLPAVDLQLPGTVIATDTHSGMQVGILWGAIDAVNGMILRLQKAVQERETNEAVVIATGGFSQFLAEHSTLIQHVEPALVLDGIRLIYERVHPAGKRTA